MHYDYKRAVQFALENAGAGVDFPHGNDGGSAAFVARCIQNGLEGISPHVTDSEALYSGLLALGAAGTKLSRLSLGDLVQIKAAATAPFKSLIVTGKGDDGEILVTSLAYSAVNRAVKSYLSHETRCLHIPISQGMNRLN